jgi:long-chain acyl-CoA synthetase
MTSLGFRHFASQAPCKLALAAPDGRHWSRGELRDECERITHGIRRRGLQPGDRVVLMLPNCSEALALNLALTQIGCVLLVINWELASPAVARILKNSGACAFFAHERAGATAQASIKEARFPPAAAFAVGAIGGFHPYQSLLVEPPDTLPAKRMAGSAESDKTGVGDEHSATARESSNPHARELAEMAQLMAQFDIQPEAHNVHFCGSPLYYPDAMLWAMNSLHYGHSVVLADKWDALSMLQAIDQYRVTTSYMVPSQFSQLLELPQALRQRYDVSSTRHMMYSTALCPPGVKRAMIDWWGTSIYEYGGRNADTDPIDDQHTLKHY